MMKSRVRYRLKRNIVFAVYVALSISASRPQTVPSLPFPLTAYTLENGLQVFLSEDPSLPLVTVAVGYRVGPLDDQEGKSGLAYLLEGLMFSGSANVGRMQQFSFIQRIGGRLNALTERDLTLYYQTVPSNHLASVLWMESDRMLSLALNTANIERARNSLFEELNNRKLTNPYWEGEELFDRLAFPDVSHHRPLRGHGEEIREITSEDVRRFYDTYYRPGNAVLCIVGDIDIKKARELVDRYFRTIPRGNPAPERPTSSERVQEARDDQVESSLARAPGFIMGYVCPPPGNGDFYALRIAEYVLFRGNSSRLYNKLIKKDRVASRLEGGIEVRGDQAVFRIFVVNNNEFMKERSRKDILSEINKLKTTRISEEELQKAKNRLKIDYVRQYATAADRAIFLSQSYLRSIPFADLTQELEKYLSVTAPRLMWTIGKYLNENRVYVDIKIR